MFIRPMPARTVASALPVPGLEYYSLTVPAAAPAPATPPATPADRAARIAEALDRMFAYYGDPA